MDNFGELLPSSPQAEASHIRPPMSRDVPTKEGSEASFRFIVLVVPELTEGELGQREHSDQSREQRVSRSCRSNFESTSQRVACCCQALLESPD